MHPQEVVESWRHLLRLPREVVNLMDSKHCKKLCSTSAKPKLDTASKLIMPELSAASKSASPEPCLEPKSASLEPNAAAPTLGYVHSIDTCGMVDGPGIRYLVFLSGCKLKCKYCHNPDTQRFNTGTIMTVNEIVKDIKLYRSYLKFSGGGVTVTGGDPLAQPAFLEALLVKCKEEGFHTAIDTAGYATASVVGRVLAHTDLVLLDIKSINAKTYKYVTNVSLDPTLDTLRISQKMGVDVWVRFVLVPGLTDDVSDMYKMAEFLAPFDNVTKIDVIPFHKTGEYKWRDLNLDYELWDTPAPSQELLSLAQGILAK